MLLASLLTALISLGALRTSLALGSRVFESPCTPEKLTAYKVVLQTFWTRDRFPKHFPEWRPQAQWSKLIGRSHNHEFVLFRLGTAASAGLRTFVESGQADTLSDVGQGHLGLFDIFSAAPIAAGAGRTESQFFVDGNHSRVSVVSHIIPSPDWFIGIDSFNLCVDGNWLDSITIEVDPLDAGTDNGFTFTAPNWATEPQGVIYRITSRYPAHPASSFYYPYLKRLPPIATFQFIKLREYELNEIFHHSEDDKKYEVVAIEDHLATQNSISLMNNNDIAEEIEEQRHEIELQMLNQPPRVLITTQLVGPTVETNHALAPGVIRKGPSKEALLTSIADSYHLSGAEQQSNSHANSINHLLKYKYMDRAKKRPKKIKAPRDCKLSEWGPWSSCSAACGIGEISRSRTIIKHPRRGGVACPPLQETKWCGSDARGCENKTRSKPGW